MYNHIFRILSITLLGIAFLSACQPAGAPDLKATAYAEATKISEQGEATAIVQAAHATANARLSQITALTPTPPALTPAAPRPNAFPADSGQATPSSVAVANLALGAAPVQTGSPTPVEVLGVSFGADGVLIVIQFKASPRVAQGWFQGSFSVTDEATGSVYTQVSVAPIIGPLVSRPREEGRAGYAMLVNQDNNQKGGLKGGELVTVTLGEYRFEHILVDKQE